MKLLRKVTIPLLSSALLLGSLASATAASLDQAMVAGENQILGSVSTVAGKGDLGETDGPANTSLFRSPWSLLPLADGSFLIADSKSHLIRKLSASEVSTYAGITFKLDAYNNPIGALLDGKLAASVFQQPKGLAADAKGNVYVADSENHAIRKIDTAGQVTTLAGNGVFGSKDAKGKEASFYSPQDVAVAADGTLYVADTLNHSIRKVSADGVVTTLNAPSTRTVEVVPGQVVPAGDYKDGELKSAMFNEPAGIAIDAKGNLYVSDTGNQMIRYIDLAAGTVTTVAGFVPEAGAPLYEKSALYAIGDIKDGEAKQARFDFPKGLAVTPGGGVVIADSLNHSVRYLKDGVVYTLAGDPNALSGFTDGPDRKAGLQNPTDVAVAADGSVWVADAYNNKIRKIDFYELPGNITNDGSIKVLNGTTPIVFESAPENVNGRVMVPIRAITEALGYKVGYKEDPATGDQTVRLTKGNVSVELGIGKMEIKRIVANTPDVVKPIDVAPYIKDDLTFVPVRFFTEELGLDVQWHGATQTVILR
ncbi:NHL domain-containing protein [Paenibacillus koleovorans]|uniref:NHL domain-containing protein n=1 Tax=Paenibacillus koleovorans TaxID=121608 RepID=UPI000FD958CB|nr:stalk domain-containing protein [Paenibacillus koleovorans]